MLSDLRWKLINAHSASLWRHQRMRRPEPVAFIDCTDPAHLSRVMAALELTDKTGQNVRFHPPDAEPHNDQT